MAMLDMSSFKAEQLELDAALVAVESMQQQAPQQGQAESSGGATRLASLRPTSTDSKEEVLRFLGRALVLPVVDGRYRAPVVTLHNSDTSNLYSLLERQLRTEYLVGAEKFWKIVRLDQHLDTWRPRVHGTQLKALLNCRLPEMPEEYVSAEKSIHSVKWALRPDTSPENFVAELRKFVAGVEVWWDHRNSRRPPADGGGASGGSKRSAPAALAAPPAKQQQVSSQPLQMQLPSPGGALPSSGPALRKSGNAAARQSQQEALVSSSPMYAHQNNLMRMHASYSENGLGGSRDSPDDLPFAGNGGPELQQLLPPGRGGQVPGIPVPSPSEPGAIIQLNVGGTPYATTVGTLTCVHGSLFWDLLNPASSGLHDPPRTALGELFLDRNGKVFTYILEYLRATANKEPYSPLPEDAQAMMALAREAEYYGLPGLVDRIRNTAIMPQAGTAAVYDSIYLETGFASIEGPSLKEMEQRKVVVMQQMNHVLAQKALDGFYVAACDCGVNHRDGPDGMQHNLFYHILLKKVMAPVHGLGSSGLVHHSQVAAAMQQHAAMAMGQVVQGMPGGLPMPMGVPMHGGPGGRR